MADANTRAAQEYIRDFAALARDLVKSLEAAEHYALSEREGAAEKRAQSIARAKADAHALAARIGPLVAAVDEVTAE